MESTLLRPSQSGTKAEVSAIRCFEVTASEIYAVAFSPGLRLTSQLRVIESFYRRIWNITAAVESTGGKLETKKRKKKKKVLD